MLAGLLPPQVAVAEAFDDPPQLTLFPEEEERIARAVPSRRREFGTGRWCARQAMAALGQPPAAIPTGARGAPAWPDGITGSITHCAGYRAAAVARTSEIAAIGIDAEPDRPLPDGVLDIVARPEEVSMLAGLGGSAAGPSWDKLLFSAKEATYKAWFPLTGRWLGFEDASVSISPDGGFAVRLLVPGPVLAGQAGRGRPLGGAGREDGAGRDGPAGDAIILDGFSGRWAASDGLVIAAIAVPALAG
ncbi:MAG TPA: 4'-phosphopantetheinyl transferase superfamily protein [Streptosporangiaceae bacterium]